MDPHHDDKPEAEKPVTPQDDQEPEDTREETHAEIGFTAVNKAHMESQGGSSKFSGFELTSEEASEKPSKVSSVDWEASEFIHHEKDWLWYLIVLVSAVAFIAFAVFLKAWSFIVLIIAMVIAVFVFANRPPRTLHFSLTPRGVAIEDRQHPYKEFRAFGVLQDGPLYSIVLLPRKRFMPQVSMYIDLDFLDTLARKMRF